MDYAYASYGDLGATHYVGFRVNIEDLITQDTRIRSSIPGEEEVKLLPPSNIRVKTISGQLVISWQKMAGLKSNVYAKIEGKSEWKKLNREPLLDHFINFKKPSVKGIYRFKITSVLNNKESRFSEEKRIEID